MGTSATVPAGKNIFRCLRRDRIRTCLLISLVVHLMMLVGVPRFRRLPTPTTEPIVVHLLEPRDTPTPPLAPERKTAAVSKKNGRPVIRPKPETKPAAAAKPIDRPAPVNPPEKAPEKQKSAEKPRPADTTGAISRIRERLTRERHQQRVDDIRRDLRDEPATPAATPPPSAAASYFLHRYADVVKKRITDHWQLPEHLSTDTLKATVVMVIDAAGTLQSVSLADSSGNRLFDASVLRAIEDSAPFPPMPAHLEIPREEFVIGFDPMDMNLR
ncbi:MAG: TonB family protein [Deltaproteobacteria bacterium]|nr:TonB family protein [Candidatus Anaeroferrophillacea bacterium]